MHLERGQNRGQGGLQDAHKKHAENQDTIIQQLEKLIKPAAQAALRKDHEQAMSVLRYERQAWEGFDRKSMNGRNRAYAEGMREVMEGVLQFVLNKTSENTGHMAITKHKEALPILHVLGRNARESMLFAVSGQAEDADDAHRKNRDCDMFFETSSMGLTELVKASKVKLRRLVDVVKDMGRCDMVRIGSKEGLLRVAITKDGIDMLDAHAPGWRKIESEQIRIIAERAAWKD